MNLNGGEVRGKHVSSNLPSEQMLTPEASWFETIDLDEIQLLAPCQQKSPIIFRYGVVANISRSHNLRDQYRGAQGSIPCTGVSKHYLLPVSAITFCCLYGGRSWLFDVLKQEQHGCLS